MLLVKYNLVPLSLNLCFHLGLSLSQQAHFAMTNAVAALDVPYVDFLFFFMWFDVCQIQLFFI